MHVPARRLGAPSLLYTSGLGFCTCRPAYFLHVCLFAAASLGFTCPLHLLPG